MYKLNCPTLTDSPYSPVLVNVASLRLVIGFAMSFDATTWVEQLGFLRSFAIYSGALAIASLGLPLVYIYGKRIRKYTSGKLDKSRADGVQVQGVGEDEDWPPRSRGRSHSMDREHPLRTKTSQKIIPVEIIDKSEISWPIGSGGPRR